MERTSLLGSSKKFSWRGTMGAFGFCHSHKSSRRQRTASHAASVGHWAPLLGFQIICTVYQTAASCPHNPPVQFCQHKEVVSELCTSGSICLFLAFQWVQARSVCYKSRKDHAFNQHGISKTKWPIFTEGLICLFLANHETEFAGCGSINSMPTEFHGICMLLFFFQ